MCPRALKEKMSLTDEQVEEMMKIKAAYRKNTQALKDRIHEKQKEMERLYRDPEAKEAGIKKINRKIIELKAKKKKRSMSYLLKLRAVFSPEQLRSLPAGSMKGLLGCGGKGACKRAGKGTCCGTPR